MEQRRGDPPGERSSEGALHDEEEPVTKPGQPMEHRRLGTSACPRSQRCAPRTPPTDQGGHQTQPFWSEAAPSRGSTVNTRCHRSRQRGEADLSPGRTPWRRRNRCAETERAAATIWRATIWRPVSRGRPLLILCPTEIARVD